MSTPKVHISRSRSQTVLEVYVPEFLARYSEEDAALWRKLMGEHDHYDIELASREFRFDGRIGGYLTPNERRRLQAELQPVLAHTDEFYAAVDGHYEKPVVAREMAIVECVYALCAMGEDYRRRTDSYGLGYQYSV